MGGSMSAAYRPPQGQQKEKLSILSLSLCLFLGVHQHILLFLAFSLSSSFSSTSISDKKINFLVCQVKNNAQGKKQDLRKQNVVGHRFDNIQGIFLSSDRTQSVMKPGYRADISAHSKCKCTQARKKRAQSSFSLILALPHLRSLHFLLLFICFCFLMYL